MKRFFTILSVSFLQFVQIPAYTDLSMQPCQEFHCQPEAEAFIKGKLDLVLDECQKLRQFRIDLYEKTSTRLFDFIDHVPATSDEIPEILRLGFEMIAEQGGVLLYSHPGAQLPFIIVDDDQQTLGIGVESIKKLAAKSGFCEDPDIEGDENSLLRTALLLSTNNYDILAVDRKAKAIVIPTSDSDFEEDEWLERYNLAKDLWDSRGRSDNGMDDAEVFSKSIVQLVGQEFAAHIILKRERKYWQSTNSVAEKQKQRQDGLGLGWANHDHHTFRSSRKNFRRLVSFFESLGFVCRERFYAGKDAGWGAQVMEHKNARYVLFLDVDLLPEEVDIDFAHVDLPDVQNLGTVGLWCALHGDSILGAGMHHLEALVDFYAMNKWLSDSKATMKPFSYFSYLKQAFSVGEIWKVDAFRLEALYAQNLITQGQMESFKNDGAIGSHFEYLERNKGYKGFNKHNVSKIIKETDPRKGDLKSSASKA